MFTLETYFSDPSSKLAQNWGGGRECKNLWDSNQVYRVLFVFRLFSPPKPNTINQNKMPIYVMINYTAINIQIDIDC